MSSPIAEVRTEVLPDPHNPQVLVKVTTESGLTGVGECWWGRMPSAAIGPHAVLAPMVATVDELLGPLCVGQDADRIERLWQRMHRGTYGYGDEGVIRIGISGIDLALWDLLGKRLGTPVAQLLGGTVHDGLPVYASLTGHGNEPGVRAAARRAADAGVRGIKLHEKDPGLVLAARDEIGPDLALMVDTNSALNRHDAVLLGRALRDADVTWLEEPAWPPRHHGTLAKVRADTGVPIAAGEHEHAPEAFERLLANGAVDWLQPEVTKLGGLTMARRVAAIAEAHNVPLALHNYSLGPSFFANVQWGLTTTGCQWLELPWLPEGESFPTGIGVPPLMDGYLTLPPAPGLGTPTR